MRPVALTCWAGPANHEVKLSPCVLEESDHTSWEFAIKVNNTGHSGGVFCGTDLDIRNQLAGVSNRDQRDPRVTYTLKQKKLTIYLIQIASPRKRGKLTDGEATLGGMRVEMLRRKIRDMANKLVS